VLEDQCGAFSTAAVGGSVESGNNFIRNRIHLAVRQTEPVNAEYNFWGSLDCAQVSQRIEGQSVRAIVDEQRTAVVFCSDTPVEATTWGRLRSLFAPGARR
jgi:hypothetical protein